MMKTEIEPFIFETKTLGGDRRRGKDNESDNANQKETTS